MTLSVLMAMVRADFRERSRRYSFLVTLAACVWLGYLVATGTIGVRLGAYRGLMNSAWIGAMMAIVTNTFLTLAGFYIVKNSLVRDQLTRVGRILSATPMSRFTYTLGKAASNFVVLSSMVGVMAVGALVIQLTKGEAAQMDWWNLLAPFLFTSLPAMACVGAVAVLFECIPGLRGGIGNVVYFFLWAFGLGAEPATHARIDVIGFGVFYRDMTTKLHAIDAAYKDSMSIGGGGGPVTKSFLWQGVDWNSADVVERAAYLLLAVAVAWLASLLFHRFDPDWESVSLRQLRGNGAKAGAELASEGTSGMSDAASIVLTPVPPLPDRLTFDSLRFGSMVRAELRLMTKGLSRWWYLVAGGLFIASVVNELKVAREVILPLSWVWPMLLWSKLGIRDRQCGTLALLESAPFGILRQLPAAWAAGVLLALTLASGVLAKLALVGDLRGMAAITIAAAAIPAFALACGSLTGQGKLFEAIYITLWYMGPMQKDSPMDFIGAHPNIAASHIPEWVLLVGVISFALALAARHRGYWQEAAVRMHLPFA